LIPIEAQGESSSRNIFLSGLIWGLASGTSGTPIKIFFLVCVIIAGLFGAITLRPTTLLIQATPALLGLIFVVYPVMF
jgi:putative membrane protein